MRIVEGQGMRVAKKTPSGWSVHLEQMLKSFRSAGLEASEISAACSQDRCVDCFDLDAVIKNLIIPVLPILAPKELSNFTGFPLSDKATAYERILSTLANSKRVSALF